VAGRQREERKSRELDGRGGRIVFRYCNLYISTKLSQNEKKKPSFPPSKWLNFAV
jgi:hypothetical protein